jgi:hypothetical protein
MFLVLYFLIFQGISWNFLVFPHENECIYSGKIWEKKNCKYFQKRKYIKICHNISWYFLVCHAFTRYFLIILGISNYFQVFPDISCFWQSISLYFLFDIWCIPVKTSKMVQDPVNKKIQVEKESRKNTKVFPNISCFWSCIFWYFVVLPCISWILQVFPDISRYFLIFSNEKVCNSWCLTLRFWLSQITGCLKRFFHVFWGSKNLIIDLIWT